MLITQYILIYSQHTVMGVYTRQACFLETPTTKLLLFT